MTLHTKINGYTAWANARLTLFNQQLGNVLADLFAGNHLRVLLESFVGKSCKKMQCMDELSHQQTVDQFEHFVTELKNAGIIPQNLEINCDLLANRNSKNVFDLLWKLITHDIWFTWERSSQLQLSNNKLICSVCFKWTPMMPGPKHEKPIPKFPLFLLGNPEELSNSEKRCALAFQTKTTETSLQSCEPFPGREAAKVYNKKIPKEGWKDYPPPEECILNIINTHLQVASVGQKLRVKSFSDLVDGCVWCYLVNSFMPGTFTVETLLNDRWTINLALKTMEELLYIPTTFTSEDLCEANSEAICAYMCFFFMCSYKFKQSGAVANRIRELNCLIAKFKLELETLPAKTQKKDLQTCLEESQTELNWLNSSYDVPFCQNWSEHAYKVQEATKQAIRRKLLEKFDLVIVPRNMSIAELCLSFAINLSLTNGSGFYLATEKETFTENRKIVLQNYNTMEFTEDFTECTGNKSIRKLLKLPLTGVVEVDPQTNPEYNFFFETKSRNRRLKMNTIILYQVFPGKMCQWQRNLFQAVKHGDTKVVRNMVKFFKDSCPEVVHSKDSATGNGALHFACRLGHFEIARQLLENGAALNMKNSNGCTPLFFAAKRQHRKMCQLLIEWGCDAHVKDSRNRTAFDAIRNDVLRKYLLNYVAYWSTAAPYIINGATDILEDIINRHVNGISRMASLKSRCISGSTLLHTAAYFGKIELIKVLLSLKVDINLLDYEGASPLHRCRDLETLQLLLDHGAIVNWSDSDGNTPLHIVCYNEIGNPNTMHCLELLLSHKATIGKLNRRELLPIHCAAIQGRIDVIQLLLQYDVDELMNMHLMKGTVPSLLYLSVANNHLECAKWLTSEGFTFKTGEQKELLFGLLQDETDVQEKIQCLEFLLRRGVNINAVDKYGHSALHYAVRKVANNDLLKSLLSCDAEVDILNHEHCTPLFYAVQTSNLHGTSLLIKYGADIRQKNNQGVTAFDYIQDYNEWIECGFFSEKLVSLFKAYELKQSCRLVRNISRKLKIVEASQQLAAFHLQFKQAYLSMPSSWVKLHPQVLF